jgi:hypothetical protein
MQARSASKDMFFRKLIIAIDEVIQDNVEFIDNETVNLSYENLERETQSELCRLFIESEDREVSECFLDPTSDIINDDVTCALMALLKENSDENKLELSELILSRTIDTYSVKLQKLIDERLQFCLSDLLYERNTSLMDYEDQYRDEYRWSRG